MPSRKSPALSLSRAAHRYVLDQELAGRSPQTVKWYRQKLAQLERFTGDQPLADLDRETLLSFIADLRAAQRSPTYVRNWVQVMHGFFGWAREQGYAIHPSLIREESRQWFTIRKPAPVQTDVVTFTREELERIEEVAADTGQEFTSRRNRLLIRLLAGTGLRISEALALTLDDVRETELRVRSGKGRKPRPVPLTRALARDISRFVEFYRPEGRSDRLLVTREGGPWSQSGVENLFYRIRHTLHMRVHAHGLRHTFATTYLRNGGEMERLRRILGHTTFVMVARYVHLSAADLGRNIEDLSPY